MNYDLLEARGLAGDNWICCICSQVNPQFALFCQNKKCKSVRGAWLCPACSYKVTAVQGVLLPDKIENCPNCGERKDNK